MVVFFSITGSFSLDLNTINSFILNNKQYSFFFFSVSSTHLFLFFLSIASFCKSAQIGFHFWLPDSMEAPAPASALIHSATLVSAGVFLLVKFNFILKNSEFFCFYIIMIGFITTLFGSFVSAYQTDLKRLLAYSTISNCGLLFISTVLNSEVSTLLLFQFHGLTKSLGFLYVGFLISKFSHNQEIRLISCHGLNLKILLIFFFFTIFYLAS